MNREQREALKNQLNELGKRWNPNPSPEDSAQQKAVGLEIYNIALRLFCPELYFDFENKSQDTLSNDLESDSRISAFNDMFAAFVKSFDPEKGELEAYMTKKFKQYRIDALRKMGVRMKKKEEINPVSGKTTIRIKPVYTEQSMNAQVSGDSEDNLCMEDILVADLSENEETNTLPDAYLLELHSQILRFADSHKGNASNSSKLNYYKLFYTNSVINYCKDDIPDEPRFQHERDILQSMKFPFVDYCMTGEPRTLPAIYHNPLRKYSEVVDAGTAGTMEQPIPIPIPNKVGVTYLDRMEEKKISDAAYSQQLTQYRKIMRKALEEKLG